MDIVPNLADMVGGEVNGVMSLFATGLENSLKTLVFDSITRLHEGLHAYASAMQTSNAILDVNTIPKRNAGA